MEVNTRVNYPIKKVLIEMENVDDINMADSLCKYCVSWFSIEVVAVGTKLFIPAVLEQPSYFRLTLPVEYIRIILGIHILHDMF